LATDTTPCLNPWPAHTGGLPFAGGGSFNDDSMPSPSLRACAGITAQALQARMTAKAAAGRCHGRQLYRFMRLLLGCHWRAASWWTVAPAYVIAAADAGGQPAIDDAARSTASGPMEANV
jgi:hypothetical protein